MAGIEELKSKLISKGGMAMSNQFLVELPTLRYSGEGKAVKGMDARTLNVLCKEVNLPGKQVMSLDHTVGLFQEKIANGFAVEDVTMTFYVPNDYGPKKYFDAWRTAIVGEGKNGIVGYKNDYTHDIVIRQLKKPVARFGFDLGPLDINLDVLGKSIYSVKLLDAFPTSLNAIQLSNDQDQIVEFSVQFSYTNWEVVENENDGLVPSIGLNLGGLI